MKAKKSKLKVLLKNIHLTRNKKPRSRKGENKVENKTFYKRLAEGLSKVNLVKQGNMVIHGQTVKTARHEDVVGSINKELYNVGILVTHEFLGYEIFENVNVVQATTQTVLIDAESGEKYPFQPFPGWAQLEQETYKGKRIDPQSLQKAITFSKKYSTIVNLHISAQLPDADDTPDNNPPQQPKAIPPSPKSPPPKSPPKQPTKTKTKKTYTYNDKINLLVSENKITIETLKLINKEFLGLEEYPKSEEQQNILYNYALACSLSDIKKIKQVYVAGKGTLPDLELSGKILQASMQDGKNE